MAINDPKGDSLEAARLAEKVLPPKEIAQADIFANVADAFLVSRTASRFGVSPELREAAKMIVDQLHKREAAARQAEKLGLEAFRQGKFSHTWAVVHEMVGPGLGSENARGVVGALRDRQALLSRLATGVNEIVAAKRPEDMKRASNNLTRTIIGLGHDIQTGAASGLTDGERQRIGEWMEESRAHFDETKMRKTLAKELAPVFRFARLELDRIGEEYQFNKDLARYLREVRSLVENDVVAAFVDNTDKMTRATALKSITLVADRIGLLEQVTARKTDLDVEDVMTWRQLVSVSKAPIDPAKFADRVYEGMSSALMAAVGTDFAVEINMDFEKNRDEYKERYANVLSYRAQMRSDRDLIVMNYCDDNGRMQALHETDVANALTSSQVKATLKPIALDPEDDLEPKQDRELRYQSLETVARAMSKSNKNLGNMDI